MKTNQTTLTGNRDEQKTTGTTEKMTKQKLQSPTTDTTLAPAEQRGGDGCCPWCLAATEMFEHHEDGRVRCGNCDAAIPVGVEWYERGEKIVI